MADTHALLAPSKAGRWIPCPGSIEAEAHFPDTTSPEAEEGTAAHELAAQALREGVAAEDYLNAVFRGYTVTAEMAEAVQQYLDYVNALPGEATVVEEWVDLSALLGADQGGTLDYGAVQVIDGWLHVADLKYGKGVQVHAQSNYQGALYAIGLMGAYEFLTDFHGATFHIIQPRLDWIDTHEFSMEELEDIGRRARESANLVYAGNAPRQPGWDICRWCPAQGSCKALADWVQKHTASEFADLDETPPPALVDQDQLTDKELSALLERVPLIRSWCNALEKQAQAKLLEGEDVPGYKLVEGKSTRKWADAEKAQKYLRNKRYKLDDIAPRVFLSPAQAEKLLGKKQFQEKLGGLVEKPRGKPTLAPVSDKRPAISEEELSGFKDLNAGSNEDTE